MNILNSVIIIFLMMGTGYILSRKKFLDEKSNNIFGKLIINLTLPSTVMVAFLERFSKQDIIDSFFKLIVCYIIILSFLIIGKLLVNFFNIEESRKAAIVNMTMFSNTLFIGLPVNSTLFGEESLPYLFIFWFASFSTFWTLGIYNFTSGKEEFSLKNSLKKLITPPLIAFFLSMILISFDISLPVAIKTAMQKFGSMTTPLAMLFLGTVIHSLDLKSFRLNRDVQLVLLGRFILAPLASIIIIFIASKFIELSPLIKKVFVTTASLPIMANLAIMSKHYKKDYEFTALMVGITTILCILTIPIYAYLLEILY